MGENKIEEILRVENVTKLRKCSRFYSIKAILCMIANAFGTTLALGGLIRDDIVNNFASRGLFSIGGMALGGAIALFYAGLAGDCVRKKRRIDARIDELLENEEEVEEEVIRPLNTMQITAEDYDNYRLQLNQRMNN